MFGCGMPHYNSKFYVDMVVIRYVNVIIFTNMTCQATFNRFKKFSSMSMQFGPIYQI